MWVRGLVAGVLPMLFSGAVLAQTACSCGSGNRVTGAALTTLLANRTVCGSAGNDSWQEFHQGSTAGGGALIDYKKGSDPSDPTETVGSWSIAADNVVYNYGSGGIYTFEVCQSAVGGVISVNFCGAARNVSGATLRTGQQSCSGSTPLGQPVAPNRPAAAPPVPAPR